MRLCKNSTSKTILGLVFAFVISLPFESHSETVSKEALFRRAHKSFAFLMLMAGQDSVFAGNLTTEEKKIYSELLMFTSSSQTHSWALNRKLETTKVVEISHEIKLLSMTTYPYPELKFSSDEKLFKLKPEQPVRTAVTTAEGSSSIWINQKKINHKNLYFNLGDAVSLLVHEFAHKLHRPDQQDAIDSLATKIKKFVDQNTQVETFDGFKVHVIKFSDGPIFSWLYDLFGVKSNKNPKWIYDQEGFYIIVENEAGFQDITDKILKTFNGFLKVTIDERNIDYQLERMHWYFSDWIRLESQGKNHLKVSANLKYFEAALTFMKETSSDPQQKKPYHNLYMGRPFDGGLIGFVQDFEIKKDSVQVIRVQEGLIRHVDPSYQTKLVNKVWQNNDLKLVYKIEGPRMLSFPGIRMSDMEIWPELLFKFNGKTLEVKALSFDKIKDEYTFILPRLKNANAGSIEISGLEWASKKPNLVHGGSSSRVSAFLEESQRFDLIGPSKETHLRLEKILPQGDYLELTFQSDETFRSLDIHQGIFAKETSTYYDTTDNGIRYEVATRERHIENIKAVVRFDETQMQQTWINGKLVVRVLLDEFVDTELDINLEPDLIPEFKDKIRKPDELTSHKYTLNPDRWFLGYKVQTESLGVFDLLLDNPIYFQKPLSLKSSARSCRDAIRP